ncbi:hypothetical protein CDAR_393271 [Caerostris darwini]|uniref:Uncharacterized protein n=1 Tax=Caerostris darwini TaxID=1538125 RepID=A0AAV4PEI2_9ARAC|nr:hypothetical protein CDAR_570301 [Caerostris darwini]GIY63520.1 hypothetical protein CDAR_393271 [Caerostris darwini]
MGDVKASSPTTYIVPRNHIGRLKIIKLRSDLLACFSWHSSKSWTRKIGFNIRLSKPNRQLQSLWQACNTIRRHWLESLPLGSMRMGGDDGTLTPAHPGIVYLKL